MEWEYKHLQVNVKDLINVKQNDAIVNQLSILSRQGWQVEQVIEVRTASDQKTSVLFLLKRKLLPSTFPAVAFRTHQVI